MERLPEQPWLLKNCVQADQRDQLARFLVGCSGGSFAQLVVIAGRRSHKVHGESPDSANVLHSGTGGNTGCHWCPSSNGFQAPMAIQLLLANFLYSPPGLLTIANAEKQLPQWLISDYQELYSVAGSASSLRRLPLQHHNNRHR